MHKKEVEAHILRLYYPFSQGGLKRFELLQAVHIVAERLIIGIILQPLLVIGFSSGLVTLGEVVSSHVVVGILVVACVILFVLLGVEDAEQFVVGCECCTVVGITLTELGNLCLLVHDLHVAGHELVYLVDVLLRLGECIGLDCGIQTLTAGNTQIVVGQREQVVGFVVAIVHQTLVVLGFTKFSASA